MASLSDDPNGSKRIQFTDAGGVRKTLRLGKISHRAAEAIGARIEELLACKIGGTAWSGDLANWVAGIVPVLRKRIEATGILPAKQKVLLGEFLDDFLLSKIGAKPNSLKNYRQVVNKLVEGFSREMDIRDLTHDKATSWYNDLCERYSKAHSGRTMKYARQFFKIAVRKKMISDNPFDGLNGGSQTNESRKVFVPREVIERVIDACPDAEWRLIVALARYAGLRCPSELVLLRWQDILPDRMVIHSPKTEHHEGRASRIVPIFPELRPYLEDAREMSSGEMVISRDYKDSNTIHNHFLAIIKKAGVLPWTRLFNNLRASCETELAGKYPLQVVCAWIGNSPILAYKHYLMVRDADFVRACTESDVKSDVIPTHFMTTTGQARSGLKMTGETEVIKESGVKLSSLEPGVTCSKPGQAQTLSVKMQKNPANNAVCEKRVSQSDVNKSKPASCQRGISAADVPCPALPGTVYQPLAAAPIAAAPGEIEAFAEACKAAAQGD